MGLPHVHKADNRRSFQKAWEATDDTQRELARQGIRRRMELRGRSLSATLVFMGFLAAAEVALVVAGIDFQRLQLRGPFWPAAVGFGVLCVGIAPSVGNLVPRYRGPEGEAALANTQCDWDYEEVRRCSTQRSQLWRLRASMAVSLIGTICTMALLMS